MHVDKIFYLIQSINPEMSKLGIYCYLLLAKHMVDWMPLKEEGRTINTKSLISDTFLSSAVVSVDGLWSAQSPPEDLFKCNQYFDFSLLTRPGTGRSGERPVGLAVQQKSFLCSCPQSLVGLEVGRRCIGAFVAELGEVFFCTCHQSIGGTEGDPH